MAKLDEYWSNVITVDIRVLITSFPQLIKQLKSNTKNLASGYSGLIGNRGYANYI